jgi:hypothetical protein
LSLADAWRVRRVEESGGRVEGGEWRESGGRRVEGEWRERRER